MDFDKEANSVMKDLQMVAQVPGGLEMLFTQAANQGRKRGGSVKKLRLYCGGEAKYQEGGLAQAEEVRSMGRGDDEVLLHVSPEEYEAIVAMWGEPDINPNTGLPEYGFLSKVWKKVKKAVKKIVKSPVFQFIAPIALNAFVPGLGAAIGSQLGLSGGLASTVGNAVVRGGIGAAGGGKEGALSGVVNALTMGGTGADIGSKLGLSGGLGKAAGNAIIGGVGGQIGGGGFAQGALGNVANAMMMEPLEKGTEGMLKSTFTPETSELSSALQTGDMSPIPGGPQMSPVPGGAPQISDMLKGSQDLPWYQDAWNWAKDNPLLAAGAAGLAYSGLSGGGGDEPPPNWQGGGSGEFFEPLPTNFDYGREFQGLSPEAYYTYGQAGGEHTFLTNNQIGRQLPGTQPPAGQPGMPPPQGQPGTNWGANPNDPHDMGYGFYNEFGEFMPWDNSEGALPYAPPAQPTAPPTMVQRDLTPDEANFLSLDLSGASSSLGKMLRNLQQQAGAGYSEGGYVGYQRGGPLGHAKGMGSGRDDTIEALLSDGEFVFDAETVSLLGDGSNSEGARRLEELRQKLRKHKGKKLMKGNFSDDAMNPEDYLPKGLGQLSDKEVKQMQKMKPSPKDSKARKKMRQRMFIKRLQQQMGD
jgi:hypothetical protein